MGNECHKSHATKRGKQLHEYISQLTTPRQRTAQRPHYPRHRILPPKSVPHLLHRNRLKGLIQRLRTRSIQSPNHIPNR